MLQVKLTRIQKNFRKKCYQKQHTANRTLLMSFISRYVTYLSLHYRQCDHKDTIIIISVIIPRSKITYIILQQSIKSFKSAKHVPLWDERYSRLRRALPSSETMNGVIWSKMQKTFVPISSVPVFAKMQQERLRQSRALETHNFQLQNLTLTSFEVCHRETQMTEFLDILRYL